MLSSTVHSLKDRYRDELLEAFTAWCGHEAALPLSGFLSFADSFDISAYLSAERVAETLKLEKMDLGAADAAALQPRGLCWKPHAWPHRY